MAINKVIYGGSTLINLTDTSAVASDVLSGKYFYGRDGVKTEGTCTYNADTSDATISGGTQMLNGVTAYDSSGTKVTGSIATKTSSDMTASGATVTVPAGYYASQTTKSVAAGSATPAATISATGATISTATNNLTLSKTVSNTPTVSAGYVSAGTAGDSSVSLTAAVTIKGAATITPMDYAQTIPANTYLTGAQTIAAMPAGTAGTPIATKGTVSNNSVSVTPSVTNTAGYIQSQTKTGTAVTVTASELVSGSQTITENGTVNVTNLAQVVVDVASASGDHTVTIASSGHSSRCYVQLNGAGQTYYSSGSTIPFSHSAGDELYIYCTGSRGGGTITVNGVQVASNPYDPVSYTLALPFADVTVNLSYGSTSQVDVTFTVPTIEITENGVHDVSSYAYANVNVSGGGGASNFVQGTFTTQSSAGVQSISVPYTGGGYPVSIMVYVAGGAYNSAISAWYNSMQRYAVGQWTCHKSVQTSAPTYATSGTQNQGVTTAIYKNSTSSSTSYTRTSAMNTNVFSSSYASNAALTCVRYHSGNVLNVYVNTSSYGLLPGIEYQYQIVYSS